MRSSSRRPRNGNRTSIVDAIGNSTPQSGDGTTTFSYDNLDRLTGVTYSDGTPAVTFAFDGAGNRTSMTDPTQSTYTYDEINRLKQVVRTGISQIDYTYDGNGNVLSRTPSGGAAVVYTYDDDGRMATAVSGGQTTSYAYDAAANEITATLPAGNGYVESRTYDNAGRLTEVKNQKGATVLSKSTYTLDPVGNRSTIVTTTGTTTLTYDPNDRLTQACYTIACTGTDNFRRYTYDDVGNRLTEVSAAGTTNYTYDALDQLVSSSGVGGNVSNTFNLDGDQTASGAQVMTYDLAHRLKTLTSGTTTTTYTYAGDGARVEASTGTQASKKTRFVWDPNRPIPELVRELDGNNALVREYQYGLDLVSMKSGSSSYYFHHDGLGSVTNLTSSTGVTQWTYDYHPFGVGRTTTKNSNQAPTNMIQFAGEYLDPTGLYHLRARQYAPTTGRFLTPDAFRNSQLGSAYVYAANTPTWRVDPSGHCPLTAIFVFALGGLGTLVGPEGTMGGAALGYGVAGAMCGVETEAEVHIVAAVIDQKQGGVIPQPEPGPQIIEPYTPGAGPPIDPDTGDQLPTSNGCSSLPCKAAAVGAATVFAGGGFLGGFAIAEGEHGYPVLGPVK